jgi:hypothetical protein
MQIVQMVLGEWSVLLVILILCCLVYPESPIPADYLTVGQVLNEGSHLCLDTMGKKTGQAPGLSGCHGMGGNQVWSLTGCFLVSCCLFRFF